MLADAHDGLAYSHQQIAIRLVPAIPRANRPRADAKKNAAGIAVCNGIPAAADAIGSRQAALRARGLRELRRLAVDVRRALPDRLAVLAADLAAVFLAGFAAFCLAVFAMVSIFLFL
jgi:hypothetical protein